LNTASGQNDDDAGLPGSRTASRLIGGWLFACLLLIGCAAGPPLAVQAEPPLPEAAEPSGWLDTSPLPTVLRLDSYPANTKHLATTSAKIYLGNLSARIAQLEKNYSAESRTDLAQALAMSLVHRAQILGGLNDSIRAGEILREQVRLNPEHGPLLLAYAGWLARFHLFELAHESLNRISSSNPLLARSMTALKAEIDLATGGYERLGAAFRQPQQGAGADPYDLASRANAAVLQGDLDLASRLYFEAQSRYRDVGPFPLAWLHTQQGIALLRFGHYEQAVRFFRAARERLPQYYLATEHLAECLVEMGEMDAARELYVEVITQTGNPEFIAALAGLERRAGRMDSAARWDLQADAGYQALLKQYPEAYVQHAAEYYLEIGDLEQAGALAHRNLELRQDVGSRLLVADVARAANDPALACAQAALVAGTGLKPPELSALLHDLSCNDQ